MPRQFLPVQFSLDLFCQRWRDKRAHYRPAGEPIDPSQFRIDTLPRGPASQFIAQHHYLSTAPAVAQARIGLFRRSSTRVDQLVGVAIFGQSAGTDVLPSWLPREKPTELLRFVLLDDVEANAETFFLAASIKVLRAIQRLLTAALAFSDPTWRVTPAGLAYGGHIGTIYQAANALYAGRAAARTRYFAPDGRELHTRLLSKIRTGR